MRRARVGWECSPLRAQLVLTSCALFPSKQLQGLGEDLHLLALAGAPVRVGGRPRWGQKCSLPLTFHHEIPDVQAGFRKGRGTRDQIANILWIIKKAREFQKNTYFCFIDYAKAFDCVDHNKLWKILQEMEIPDHLTCLLKKSVCRSGRNGLVPNQERSMSRLYTITLLI